MFSTSLPPATLMCASCGVVITRSVLKSPCDLISSSVCDSCFSNSASIKQFQSKRARCKARKSRLLDGVREQKHINRFPGDVRLIEDDVGVQPSIIPKVLCAES